jgi:hypothetical protein
MVVRFIVTVGFPIGVNNISPKRLTHREVGAQSYGSVYTQTAKLPNGLYPAVFYFPVRKFLEKGVLVIKTIIQTKSSLYYPE